MMTSEATDKKPAGWYYRLSPNLLLADRQQAKGSENSEKILVIKSGRAFPLGHPTTRLCLDLLTEASGGEAGAGPGGNRLRQRGHLPGRGGAGGAPGHRS